MKKDQTQEWREIKEKREAASFDYSNPLADFLRSLPKKEQDLFMDMYMPNWREREIEGKIRASWRRYRGVRNTYFLDKKTEHAKSQIWAMNLYKKNMKKNIKKLRDMSKKKLKARP